MNNREIGIKPLPQNIDAEIATLGSVLIDGNVIELLQDLLQADDFCNTKHQKIFSTMLNMHIKGISIDIITLSNVLKSNGLIGEIGGAYYLAHLEEMCPSSANYKYYADIIKEFSNQRKLSEKLIAILTDIKDNKIDYAGREKNKSPP